jgi:hypothetical protein
MKRTVFVKATSLLRFALVGALLAGLVACASTPGASGGASTSASASEPPRIPAQITKWQEDNGASSYFGLGISTSKNLDTAYGTALNLATENLGRSIETDVAGITENYLQEAEARGETDRVAMYKNSTMQLINQTIRGSKPFGPYVNDRDETFVIAYLNPQQAKSLRDQVMAIAEETFADERVELKNMLGVN